MWNITFFSRHEVCFAKNTTIENASNAIDDNVAKEIDDILDSPYLLNAIGHVLCCFLYIGLLMYPHKMPGKYSNHCCQIPIFCQNLLIKFSNVREISSWHNWLKCLSSNKIDFQ